MQITDITNDDVRNISITRLVNLAKTNIVVLSFGQWKEIIGQRTDIETYAAINQLFIQIAYMGVFESTDEKGSFNIGIFTGTKIPVGLVNEWTQIKDLRIATPHTTNLPWIVFRTRIALSDIEISFMRSFFEFTTHAYINKNVTMYALTTNSFVVNEDDDQETWYWVYGDIIEEIPEGVNARTLIPMPGTDNSVLLVDKSNNTHSYTFDPNVGKLIEIPTRTVL